MFLHPVIVDPQIELRLLRPEHLAAHFALIEANREHLSQWEDWALKATFETQRVYIHRKLDQFIDGEGFAASIFYRADPTDEFQLAGSISLAIDPAILSAEIGYWLAANFTGKGIITRSVKTVVEYAFKEANLNRILLQAAEGNIASRAVAERVGFCLDGIIRHHAMYKDLFINRAVYTLLREQWEQQQHKPV